MKENFDDNNQFYKLSENNIVNSNSNLILPFENNYTKDNKNFEYNSKSEPYKIIIGKYNEINDVLYETNIKIYFIKYNSKNLNGTTFKNM